MIKLHEENKMEQNKESINVPGTIFDDVFRTIAQKMPKLLIPLINEVFQTKYSENQPFEQLRNEHYEKQGTIITDSILRIENHLYHIECQSDKDGQMALRMIEYDFSIALENAVDENGVYEINFPESCVLYLRNHRDLPQYHQAVIRFGDGQRMEYRIPIIAAQNYTVSDIFEKNLLLLLPFHILRYESFLKSNSLNQKKVELLLEDYRQIVENLQKTAEQTEKSLLYKGLIELINQIANYIIPEQNPIGKEFQKIMGGRVLELSTDAIYAQIAEGRKEGLDEGQAKATELCAMLFNSGRIDDLKRSFTDPEFQKSLLAELFPEE